MAVHLADDADARFAVCLDNLESGEASRRRQAIAALEKMGGVRALQVAAALTSDADQVVASSARRICSEAGKKGLMLRSFLKTQALAKTISIKSFMQLLDEVVFVIRRNLMGIARDSFMFSVPKFVMVSVFFMCPFFPLLLDLVRQVWLVCLLIFIYQIFWRPLVWLSTGTAFMAGFPENTFRRQSRKSGGWGLYNKLAKAGALEAILYSLVLSGIYWWYLSIRDLSTFILLVFLVWLMVWANSVCSIPAMLFADKDKGDVVWLSGYSGNLWLSVKFGMVLLALYLIIVGSSVSLFWLLGLDNWIDGPLIFVFGSFIAADALIDPFVVGYRLLLARLSMDPRQL